MHDTQYPIVAARRQGYDSLLWQVPAIGIAAQGVLVAAALNKDVSSNLSILLLSLSAVVGVAIVWLFRKLRFHEVADSELLKEYELSRAIDGFAVVHGRRGRGISGYVVWLAIMITGTALEIGSIVRLIAN